MNARLFTFVGGDIGSWRVAEMKTIVGEPLANVTNINVVSGAVALLPQEAKWLLRGITSNERYVIQEEKGQLTAKQPSLGRSEATCAALIPIRKIASAFLDVGGFEPKFFLDGEEELLALDLVARDWKLVYTDQITVHHHPSPHRDPALRRRMLTRNACG
jgi:GT2 family glycosyltransferase